jgi:hypothetical protein
MGTLFCTNRWEDLQDQSVKQPANYESEKSKKIRDWSSLFLFAMLGMVIVIFSSCLAGAGRGRLRFAPALLKFGVLLKG